MAKEENAKRKTKKKDDAQVMKTFQLKFLYVALISAFTLLFFDLYINWLKGFQPYLLGVFPINFNYVGYHTFPYFFILALPWLALLVYLPRYANYWLAGMVFSNLVNDLLWPLFCKNMIDCLYREFWSDKIWMYVDLGFTKIPVTGKGMLAFTIFRIALLYGLLTKFSREEK